MHREVAGIADLVQTLKHGVEVDSAWLPQSKVSGGCACSGRLPRRSASRDRLRTSSSPPTCCDDATFDTGLRSAARAGRLALTHFGSRIQNPLVLRININNPRSDALDHIRTITLGIVHPIDRLVGESEIGTVDLSKGVNRVIN